VMRPSVRRKVAGHLQKACGVNKRMACRASDFHRSTQRYRKRSDSQTELRIRLKEIAATLVRYGYRRLHKLVRRAGWAVNKKRIHRLYRDEELIIRSKLLKRKRAWRCRSDC